MTMLLNPIWSALNFSLLNIITATINDLLKRKSNLKQLIENNNNKNNHSFPPPPPFDSKVRLQFWFEENLQGGKEIWTNDGSQC